MKKIKKTSLALAIFYLFSILYFATTVQAQIQGKTQDANKNKICPQVVKEMQMRIKSLKKVHKGMYNSIYSSLPSDRIDRYNRHVNILAGNLSREVNLMKGVLEKLQQQDRICHEMAQGLSPHIHKMHETQASIYTAIFNSNISNYKKLVEKFGHQVKGISDELDKHFSRP
jgi:hypothetical protein